LVAPLGLVETQGHCRGGPVDPRLGEPEKNPRRTKQKSSVELRKKKPPAPLPRRLRPRPCRSRVAARLAARPRPNLPPRLPLPRERPPAFCAAWSACARKGFVLGARVERIRPGRMRKSSLRVIVCSHNVSKAERQYRVAENRKLFVAFAMFAASSEFADVSSPNRPAAPCGFYPALVGRGSPAAIFRA